MLTGDWRRPEHSRRLRPSGCVRGRRTLAVLTFVCQSDQSAWPCGRSGCPQEPSLCPWYLPNGRHYINLTAATGYESTQTPHGTSCVIRLQTSYLAITSTFLTSDGHMIFSTQLLMMFYIQTNQLLFFFDGILPVKRCFSSQLALFKHWLNQRTQTWFGGNYWQMNCQNTLSLSGFFFRALAF